jgi:hypothetical protein
MGIEYDRLLGRIIKTTGNKLTEREAARIIERAVAEITRINLDYKTEGHYLGWLDYRDEIRQTFTGFKK